MMFPSIHNQHWAIKSTICFEKESEPVTVNNRLSYVLSINEVADYILETRGDFLQLATIANIPKRSVVILKNAES